MPSIPLRQHVWVASLVVVAVAVVFGVACGAGDKTIEERWARLDVPEAEIVFLGDFTEAEQDAIAREVKSVQVAFAQRFDVVTSEFTLYISTEFEALNAAYREWIAPDFRQRSTELPRWFTCGGFAGREAIFISLATCDEEERERGGPIAHEYFHILQRDLGLIGGSENSWLNWLMEGSAEYAEAHYEEEQGRGTVSWRREAARLEWSAIRVCFPGPCNRSWPTVPDYTESDRSVFRNEIGFLAVDWLVERKGEAALMEFFRLGGGHHEFEEAFGMTPEEFGEGMDKLWRKVAPPFKWRVTGKVLDPDGRPVSYARVDVLMEVEEERIAVTGDRTNSRGEFEAYRPDEDHTLGVLLKCPDGSSAYWAFAGEWGLEGFVADADGRFESDDQGAEPFAGEERNRLGILIQLPETRKALLDRHCE